MLSHLSPPPKAPHLAAAVECKYLGPNEHQDGAQVAAGGLQQLEHVGEYAHRQCQVNSPGAHVQEAAQQHQRTQPVHLAQQDLGRGAERGGGGGKREGREVRVVLVVVGV